METKMLAIQAKDGESVEQTILRGLRENGLGFIADDIESGRAKLADLASFGLEEDDCDCPDCQARRAVEANDDIKVETEFTPADTSFVSRGKAASTSYDNGVKAGREQMLSEIKAEGNWIDMRDETVVDKVRDHVIDAMTTHAVASGAHPAVVDYLRNAGGMTLPERIEARVREMMAEEKAAGNMQPLPAVVEELLVRKLVDERMGQIMSMADADRAGLRH